MNVAVTVRMMKVVGGVLLGGALALAQGPGGMGGGSGFGQNRPPVERALGPQGQAGQWWNNPRMVDELKLTDDQRKAMDAILLQHREHLIDLRATLQKLELEMQPMMKADQPNENQILAQIDKVAQARAELEKANARFLLDIRAKLTPDQWKQLQDLRANGMRNHQQGDQDRGPGQGQRQWRQRQGGGQQDNPPPPPQGGVQAPAGAGDVQ